MNLYDIIIVGAGPVGISIARKLDRKYKVLIIEKKKVISIDKSWAVPRTWLEKASFDKYIGNEINKIGLYSYLNDNYSTLKLPSNYKGGVIDSEIFFKDSIRIIKQKSFYILKDTEIIRYIKKRNTVTLESQKGNKYKSRLIIDCSGVNSIFIKDSRNLNRIFYYSLYGIRYENSKLDPHCTFIPAFLGQDKKGHNILVNNLSEDGKSCLLWSMILDKKKHNISYMREFFENIRRSKFWNDNFLGFKEVGEQYGIIPLKKSKPFVQKRILSLGDAGAYAPWANGMSLSFTIKNLHIIISRIENSLENNRLKINNLKKVFSYTKDEELNYEFNKLLYIYAMNSTPKQLTEIIELFKGKNSLHFLKIIIYLNESLNSFKKITFSIIKKFKLKNFLHIISKDGWKQEVISLNNIFKNRIENLFLKFKNNLTSFSF